MSRGKAVLLSGVNAVLRGLRTLRDDLCTMRPYPLPVTGRLRRLPQVVVCLAAFGVFIGGVSYQMNSGQVVAQYAFPLAAGQAGAVVLALRRPVAAWWLSLASAILLAVTVQPSLESGRVDGFQWPWTAAGLIGHLFVLLLLALRVRTRVALEVLALTVLVTYVLQVPVGAGDQQSTAVVTTALSAVVVVLGIALRGRREARAELVQQTSLTAEERARRTLLEERSRIARELHDVVAHHMSVISIQAQVAEHLTENPSEKLKENLAGIRHNALEALTELRRVLAVLRSADPDDPYGLGEPGTAAAPQAPQPTLDRLGALVENTRAAGLAVALEVTDERSTARSYPPGVELSAYRIVQEALSNALRHAPGSTVRVEVVHVAEGLRLHIVNSAPKRAVPASPGAGHGLLGMRERAAMLGGQVTAARTPHGGFAVSAFLPHDGGTSLDGPLLPAPRIEHDDPDGLPVVRLHPPAAPTAGADAPVMTGSPHPTEEDPTQPAPTEEDPAGEGRP
ncbi:sensor histidine kinase [Streptomyces thermodiastaticus]